jgi:hypothetical protein
MAVLQNCVDVEEGETGSSSEKCVMCDADGNDAVSVVVEAVINVNDEIQEGASFPPIKNEHHVRLWGVCEVLAVEIVK